MFTQAYDENGNPLFETVTDPETGDTQEIPQLEIATQIQRPISQDQTVVGLFTVPDIFATPEETAEVKASPSANKPSSVEKSQAKAREREQRQMQRQERQAAREAKSAAAKAKIESRPKDHMPGKDRPARMKGGF